jgi:hypothetical protein
MNPDQETAAPSAAAPTYRLAPPTGRLGEPPEPADPLAKITLTPRRFAGVLAVAGMLLGLVLALVPVHVASLDRDLAGSVSCGNTIGGVETPLLADGLGSEDPDVLATYVGTCQDAIGTRLLFAWPMFFAGMVGFVWLGVVRREPSAGELARVEHA